MSPPMASEAITVIQYPSEITRRRFARRLRTRIAWVTGSNCGGFLMAVLTTGWRVRISVLVLVSACSVAAIAQERRQAYSPPDLTTVHAVPAEHGMVVAQEKLAAEV